MMKRYAMLREYLRTCRRVRREPSPEGFKKIEYLRFIGANICPACGEEVAAEAYVCVRNAEGQIIEKYRCSICGVDYVFPSEVVH